MNVYELSSDLVVAKQNVIDGRDNLKNKKYNEAKSQFLYSLNIYKQVLKEADISDPKGDYYSKFAFIAARQNIIKVVNEFKKIKDKSVKDCRFLEDLLKEVEAIKISKGDENLFYRQIFEG